MGHPGHTQYTMSHNIFDQSIHFLAFLEAILIPAPYYAGFDQDLFIENEVIRFPVHLSSEVRIYNCSYLIFFFNIA